MTSSSPRTINPYDFLETGDGRHWTPERDAHAWTSSYTALRQAIVNTSADARVIIVCGLQGAGKTTWISTQHISTDTIYFDAALPRVRHRRPIVDIARSCGATVEAVWIKVPLETALARNAQRPADKIVPVAAIQSVAAQFEAPKLDEGFEIVRVIE